MRKLILLAAVQERNSNVLLLLGDVVTFKSNLRGNDLARLWLPKAAGQGSYWVRTVNHLLIKAALEVFLHAADGHPVLRPLRPAHMGHHGAQVDLNHLLKSEPLLFPFT